MKKISTLYKKNPEDLSRVMPELNPENDWVLRGEGVATRKFDGTAAAIIDGEIYKRYDAKPGREIPASAIPCQAADEKTGHHPHWLKCDRNKVEDKYFFEAFDALKDKQDGTYELCGPKVQRNPEKIDNHQLIKHGAQPIELPDLDFESIKAYLSDPKNDIEGIVFHHKTDARMCKIRKSDFGIKR